MGGLEATPPAGAGPGPPSVRRGPRCRVRVCAFYCFQGHYTLLLGLLILLLSPLF